MRPGNSGDREKRQGLTVLFFKGHLSSNKQKQYLLAKSTCGARAYVSPEMETAEHLFKENLQHLPLLPDPSAVSQALKLFYKQGTW